MHTLTRPRQRANHTAADKLGIAIEEPITDAGPTLERTMRFLAASFPIVGSGIGGSERESNDTRLSIRAHPSVSDITRLIAHHHAVNTPRHLQVANFLVAPRQLHFEPSGAESSVQEGACCRGARG